MARKPTTASQQQLLEHTLATLAAMIKDLSSRTEMKITFEQYEDEDAHVYVHPHPGMTAEEVNRLEMAVGAFFLQRRKVREKSTN